ncbi:helix-turn-helix transcriptional regulator [Roseibium sp.]|uniref:helix-turn-helix transcriptional regulator n=1 Tax=Roseibium sp. TaxID=1936156 RepID=UPI003B51D902
MNIEQLNNIIGKLYAATNGRECWDNVVNEIGDTLELGVIHLFLADLKSEFSYFGSSPRGNPEFDLKYQQEYSVHDFRLPRITAMKRGLMFDERSIATNDEIKKSPLHQELFVKNDIFNILGSNMSVDGAFGWFGVTTKGISEEFTSEQRNALNYLSPHILQAFDLAKTNIDLKYIKKATGQLLCSANIGVAFCEAGYIVDIGNLDETIFKHGFLRLVSGQLHCRDVRSNERLRAFLVSDRRSSYGQLRLSDHERQHDYFLKLKNISPLAGLAERKLLIIKVLERDKIPDLEAVTQFGNNYRLSDAQISVVHAVLCNIPLSKLADMRGVKLDTVRKQLKAAMEKLGVRSQKEMAVLFEQATQI